MKALQGVSFLSLLAFWPRRVLSEDVDAICCSRINLKANKEVTPAMTNKDFLGKYYRSSSTPEAAYVHENGIKVGHIKRSNNKWQVHSGEVRENSAPLMTLANCNSSCPENCNPAEEWKYYSEEYDQLTPTSSIILTCMNDDFKDFFQMDLTTKDPYYFGCWRKSADAVASCPSCVSFADRLKLGCMECFTSAIGPESPCMPTICDVLKDIGGTDVCPKRPNTSPDNTTCTEEDRQALKRGPSIAIDQIDQLLKACRKDFYDRFGGFCLSCKPSCFNKRIVMDRKISAKCSQCVDEYLVCSMEKCDACRSPMEEWWVWGHGGMMIECQVCTHEKCKGKGRECGISINELFRGSA